jgi:GNAT superfamily N-acetyltransferase
MRIREATVDDIPQMHCIRMRVRENVLTDPASIQPHHYRSLLEAGGRGWVAELDDHIVGFAVADVERAQVWALFVDPDREGLGIGRRLHDTMLGWLFDRGLERAWLTTTRGTRAERFYRAAGWRESGVDASGEVRFEMTRPFTAPQA